MSSILLSGVNITRSTLNLRIKPEDKILIDRAANTHALPVKREPSSYWKLRGVPPEETLADLRVIDVSTDVYQQSLPDWIWHHSPVRR